MAAGLIAPRRKTLLERKSGDPKKRRTECHDGPQIKRHGSVSLDKVFRFFCRLREADRKAAGERVWLCRKESVIACLREKMKFHGVRPDRGTAPDERKVRERKAGELGALPETRGAAGIMRSR